MSEIERSEEQSQQAPETPAPVSPSALPGERLPHQEGASNSPGGYIAFERVSPLPPPVEYREYAELIPNGADRLMQMAERQQSHEHGMNRK